MFVIEGVYPILVLMRLVITPWYSSGWNTSQGEALSIALSQFWPLLKYYIIRRRIRRFQGSAKTLVNIDYLCLVLELVAGISGIIVYSNSSW